LRGDVLTVLQEKLLQRGARKGQMRKEGTDNYLGKGGSGARGIPEGEEGKHSSGLQKKKEQRSIRNAKRPTGKGAPK